MGHFSIRWRPTRRRTHPLRPRSGAQRSDAEPPSAPPPSLPSAAPAPKPRKTPAGGRSNERLMLYGSSALVLIIVIVIIIFATSGGHRILAYVPKGQKAVHVVDIRRFLRSPVFEALKKAEHRFAKGIEEGPSQHGINLRTDVAQMLSADGAAGDHGMILFGRFRADRVRSEFEEEIEDVKPGAALDIKAREVEGREYAHYAKEQRDRALATIGSTVACSGSGRFVRRVLKVRAGLYDGLLDDKDFASAHDSSRASGALLFRLEKANGRMLRKIAAILAEAEKDRKAEDRKGDKEPTAGFFALETDGDGTRVTIRLAARDKATAEALKKRLDAQAFLTGLRKFIGAAKDPKTALGESCVVIQAALTGEEFADIAKKDAKKPGEVTNLVLDLLMS